MSYSSGCRSIQEDPGSSSCCSNSVLRMTYLGRVSKSLRWHPSHKTRNLCRLLASLSTGSSLYVRFWRKTLKGSRLCKTCIHLCYKHSSRRSIGRHERKLFLYSFLWESICKALDSCRVCSSSQSSLRIRQQFRSRSGAKPASKPRRRSDVWSPVWTGYSRRTKS